MVWGGGGEGRGGRVGLNRKEMKRTRKERFMG